MGCFETSDRGGKSPIHVDNAGFWPSSHKVTENVLFGIASDMNNGKSPTANGLYLTQFVRLRRKLATSHREMRRTLRDMGKISLKERRDGDGSRKKTENMGMEGRISACMLAWGSNVKYIDLESKKTIA